MSAPAQRVPVSTWLAVAGFSVFWIMLGSVVAPGAMKHDFLSFYRGASIALDGQFRVLYDPQEIWARQRATLPELQHLVPFTRLPSYAAFLAPFALLPLPAAFWTWIGIQVGSLLALWAWCRRRWGGDSLILCSLFLPAALGIAHGQDCVWMACIVAGIYGLAQERRDLPAGFVLGLGFIKFHLFLLWPLALLMQKRWKTVAGASLAVAAHVGFALAATGWKGLVAYADLLQRKDLELVNPSPELMINVQGLAANTGVQGAWLPAVLILTVVVLTAFACWQAPLWRWISAATVGSLLISPHVYGYDASMLLAPLIACVFEQGVPKRIKICATALLAPLVFFSTLAGKPWAAATPLVLLFFLANLASSASATLPIYDLRSKDLEPAS